MAHAELGARAAGAWSPQVCSKVDLPLIATGCNHGAP